MPSSNLAVWPLILHFIHEVPHDAILDVGPGRGKAAVLLREYLWPTPTRIDAVEAHVPYIPAHRLNFLYDSVTGGDVCDLAASSFAPYDVVLMGDVIEHIDKERALELLDRIRCRVVIATPTDFFQTDDGLPATERHVSHWTRADFAADRVERIDENHIGGLIVRLGPLA